MRNALTIHPKVAGSSLAGALTLIVLWGLSYVPGLTITPEVAAALAVVISFVGGWLAPKSP